MSNNPFRPQAQQSTTLRDIILQAATQSIRFHDDIANFILRLLKDAEAVDQKFTLANNQLEGVLAGHVEVLKLKSDNERFNALLLETRMNSSKGNAIINDFRSELLPFFTEMSVSTEDKLTEFGGYMEQLDGCNDETQRIKDGFVTLCQSIAERRAGIAKAVEEMNAEDGKMVEKTKKKLQDVDDRIRRVEAKMNSAVKDLSYRLGGVLQQIQLGVVALYNLIYVTQYAYRQAQSHHHGNYGGAPQDASRRGGILSRFTNWAGNSSEATRYDEYNYSERRRDSQERNVTRTPGTSAYANGYGAAVPHSDAASSGEGLGGADPPSYSASVPQSGEAERRAERELSRVQIQPSDLPTQRDMQSNIQEMEELSASRCKYVTRIDDLNTKIALRTTIADVVGDLPEEIGRLSSDVINFVNIYPQLKAQCEKLRAPIAGGVSTSGELRSIITELTQLLPALERGLRAYAVARNEADIRAQMSG